VLNESDEDAKYGCHHWLLHFQTHVVLLYCS